MRRISNTIQIHQCWTEPVPAVTSANPVTRLPAMTQTFFQHTAGGSKLTGSIKPCRSRLHFKLPLLVKLSQTLVFLNSPDSAFMSRCGRSRLLHRAQCAALINDILIAAWNSVLIPIDSAQLPPSSSFIR